MATRTHRQRARPSAGTDWLASCAAHPDDAYLAWAAHCLAAIATGSPWLAAEAPLVESVTAMQRIGPGRLGPVLAFPEAERVWWLVDRKAEEQLADVPRLLVHPTGWVLRAPPADRSLSGRCWLERPDGSGLLTDAELLGAAFGPSGHLPAGAFG